MMPATIEEIARAIGVSEKTVREWIRRHGCPTLKKGGKGEGNAAIVDAARFPAWYADYSGRPVTPISGYFKEMHRGRNPLREMHDVHRRGFMWALAHALHAWATGDDEDGPDADYRAAGLTEAQAHAVAFKLWGIAAMVAVAYQTDRLDKDIDRDINGNLDDWFSMLTAGSFRTHWPEPKISIPPKIAELAPPDIRAKLDAMAGASNTDE